MARSFHRKQTLSALSTIDVTPLIDLAFSLLIIFMITAPLLEQTIALDLPLESQRAQAPKQDQRFETISINAKGQIYWGKEAVDLKTLEEFLRSAAERPEAPVINVRADKSLSYQKIVEILDLLKKYELSKLHLDTQAR